MVPGMMVGLLIILYEGETPAVPSGAAYASRTEFLLSRWCSVISEGVAGGGSCYKQAVVVCNLCMVCLSFALQGK